jgi:peptidoglycan/LPS O-acetylase OafA/YrhL
MMRAAPPSIAKARAPVDRNPYYPALDGMRGLAAIAVVALHVTTIFDLGYRPLHAHLAVDMFFMLSGLVIANTYEDRLRAGMPLGQFLTQRIVRLYPLTLLGVLAGGAALAGAMLSHQALSWGGVLLSVASSALLIPSPFLLAFRPWAFPGNSPLWSLSVEIVVNIAYALGAAALGLRLLIALVVAGALGLVVIALACHGLDVGFAWDNYLLGIARAAGAFLAGVLIFRLCRARKVVGGWAHGAPFLMLALLFAPLARNGVFDSLAVIAAFPAALVAGMRAPARPKLDKAWKILGAYSYPVYVLHYPIILICARATKSLQGSQTGLIVSVAGTVLVVGLCAHVALRLYDMPARRALRRLFDLSRLPLPVALPAQVRPRPPTPPFASTER